VRRMHQAVLGKNKNWKVCMLNRLIIQSCLYKIDLSLSSSLCFLHSEGIVKPEWYKFLFVFTNLFCVVV